MAGAEARVAPLPSRIGRHAVVGYIATGGMAELFLGKEPTGKPVVIKRILPHLARQTTFVSMFIDEARIGSRAKHPNLVEVMELGQVGMDLFLVMEYLVGENLAGLVRRLTKRKERISYGLCAYIIAEVCDGLHFAHELKDDESGDPLELVHRDVSPQNVFVTYGGDVKLLDFGVATASQRLTQTASGEVKGKYAYMSPEQCRGEPLDRRSDIFSLGTVLYELTTLRRLFKRPNELQVMRAITEDPIPRPSREIPDYPPALEEICVRALARDPEERYATAAEMREDLLKAMPQLTPDGDPHEAIASKFARIFSDRMTQKRELLERVRRGGELGELLAPEIDVEVEVPIVSHGDATPLSDMRRQTEPVKRKKRTRSRYTGFVIAFAVAIASGAGIGAYLRTRSHAVHQKQEKLAVVQLPTPPAPDPSPVEVKVQGVEEVAPVDEYIVISVDTDPDGVKVKVDGESRGATPIDVRVKRGETPLKVELAQTGFDTHQLDVIPDRDQRLYFALMKQQKKIVPVRTPPKTERKPGFRRFD
ncbi:MAG TPA: serine/threonine-protein kinase [Kofleriaceae bacterium]|nr:serine/threonine-protein kinase [Kofleriaceae bacterium]